MEEHPQVVEAQKYVDDLTERFLKHAELLPIADAAVAAHGDKISDGVYVRLGYRPFHLSGVTIYATVKAMKEVVPMLRYLRLQGGLKIKNFSDVPSENKRIYKFSERLRVEARISKDGATCQYVQVGVKEEPVYALKCDDEKPEPAPALEESKPTMDFKLNDGSPALELEHKEDTNALRS